MDFTVNTKLTKHLDMLVGYSHFFAGAYLDESGAGDDADFAYLMLTLPLETWIRFIIWMALGFLIYFVYGYKRSRLAGRDPQDSGIPSMTST